MRTLELLAPAKNLECGIAAIDHGADAVYIGASRFGARAAAGNSVSDIHLLCKYAHQFSAKVYVTVNTILYDSELKDTFHLVDELTDAGVDALLVQDMSLVEKLSESGLPIHASTQTDNRSADKVAWLGSIGCKRVVLARELSLDEIADIHAAVPDMELETFVHGALCVSYSGLCYASQHCFNRSANRGECAQFCRLKFDLYDADGKEIENQRHLLSLKDMCQIDHLEELADAGASSFKIEGRLKDAAYVKNVVSAYSQRLNQIIKKHPTEYRRASRGEVAYTFTPNLSKTFNRGFTTYFLKGRQPDIASFDTPKALGEYVGHVKELRGNSFNVAGTASFANGDGLCFINDSHELEGFRVNKVEGNRLFPFKMSEHLRPGQALYRNNDEAFEKILSGKTAERKILVKMLFGITKNGFSLKMSTDDGKIEGEGMVEFEHQQAQKPQHDNIIKQLSKLGDTPYKCFSVEVAPGADACFVPSSILSDLRRKCVESIRIKENSSESRQADASAMNIPQEGWQPEYRQYPYLYNISNAKANDFYKFHGMENPQEAFEIKPVKDPLIMQCRHCIRYSLGYCVRHGGKHPTWQEPLYLQLPDGHRFRLQFKCDECQMNVYAES